MTSQLVKRYLWLIETIQSAGSISYEEINERWKRCSMSDGRELPLRTFHNHREAIEDLFGLIIACTRGSGYRYYIKNDELLRKDAVKGWLLESFALKNQLDESQRLADRILLEKIPSGRQFLVPLLEAMRQGRQVKICYQSFHHDTPATFPIEPYCMKLFRQRWYVVGNSPALDSLYIYSLDRIHSLETTDIPFTLPADFDAREYFACCFGIIADEREAPVSIRLRAWGSKAQYLRTLPLHSSQQETETGDDYAIFELYLRPTYDFYQELLSHGSELEVLSPEPVRRHMADTIREMLAMYEESGAQ